MPAINIAPIPAINIAVNIYCIIDSKGIERMD